MYSKYSYLAGATVANILADVCKILTGTTDKALLSVSCDQANTEILATYEAAGWTMHDDTQSAYKVLSAPQADFGSKYAKIITTSNSITLGVAESWNATTHVGVNVTDHSASNVAQAISTTAAGFLIISANSRKMIISSFVSGGVGWGGGVWSAGWNAIFERVRGINAADTAGAALPLSILAEPSAGIINTSVNYTKFCRHIGGSNGQSVVGLAAQAETPHKGIMSTFASANVPSAKIWKDGALAYPIFPFSYVNLTNYALSGNISALNDVWLFPPGAGAVEDTIVHNGKTYVMINQQKATGTPTNMYGWLMVPKG